MDISSTNPLSPSPLYRDGVAARQRELPQTEGIESAGQQAVEAASARDAQLQAAIQKLDEEIKDVSALKAEIDSLKARQRAVEDLQTDRNMPVYLLNELVAQTPEGIYLSSIRQNGQDVLVTGAAQTNERVSEFLRNTNSRSEWFQRPELVEIKAATVNAKSARDTKRLFEFTMRVGLKRPGEVAAPAGAASGPAAASGVMPAAKGK